MRRIAVIAFVLLACNALLAAGFSSTAILLPGRHAPSKPGFSISNFKARDLSKVIKRPLTLKEKIEFDIAKLALNKKLKKLPGYHKDDMDKAQLALVLGIIGLAGLVVPFVGLLSLPCAIAALIIGYNVRRHDPFNKKAKTAITLGWITVGLFILALIIVIAVLAAFAWY